MNNMRPCFDGREREKEEKAKEERERVSISNSTSAFRLHEFDYIGLFIGIADTHVHCTHIHTMCIGNRIENTNSTFTQTHNRRMYMRSSGKVKK